MEVGAPNGPMRMWFAGEHLEIERPSRLVYTESMVGEDGAPMAPAGHPETTEVHVELAEASDRTEMRLTHVGVAAGWTMALDKLAARLRASSIR